jgi:hypothetical protein
MDFRFRPVADICADVHPCAMPKITEVQQALSLYLEAIRGTEMHALCPMCDQQGEIVEATYAPSGETIFICDECDSVWLARSDLRSPHGVQGFHEYAAKWNGHPVWTELHIPKVR